MENQKEIKSTDIDFRAKDQILLPNQNTENDIDTINALQNFLLDIECLDPLDEWINTFNIFDILKISRTEIRHSNMLAWLLNPNENHGFGDLILKNLVQYVVKSFSSDADIFKVLLMDYYDFVIRREWHHIDIVAVSAAEKCVLCIENKIDSGEHDNQLTRYKKTIDDNYPGYLKFFVFLSPYGYESSDTENWCSVSYQVILDIIESARKKVTLFPYAELLINNYTDTIRREIVGDERLSEICAEIYAKHQKALDLIFENKPDKFSDLAGILKDWARERSEDGKIEYVAEKSGKTYIRFKTESMSKMLPDADEPLSGWNTKNYYFYEIRNNDGSEFFIHLALSSKDIPDHLLAVCEKINQYYPAKQKKEKWQWRTPFSTKHVKVDDELSKEKIYRQLDAKLEEIKQFEADLEKKLGE